jgi:hypothetical protein
MVLSLLVLVLAASFITTSTILRVMFGPATSPASYPAELGPGQLRDGLSPATSVVGAARKGIHRRKKRDKRGSTGQRALGVSRTLTTMRDSVCFSEGLRGGCRRQKGNRRGRLMLGVVG